MNIIQNPKFDIISNNKMSITFGIVLIIIVSIDLLMTRQLLPYDNISASIMFALTTLIGYGIGSLILLAFAHNISKEMRNQSRFNNFIHWSVITIQGILFFTLLLILLASRPNYYLAMWVFAISSILATIIMGVIGYKFFIWYKASKYKNSILLFYFLASITLGMSIIEDAGTKLLMVSIVQEKSNENDSNGSSFLYKPSEKYNGQIVFKYTQAEITTLFIIPNAYLDTYNYLNSIVLPIGFVLRWIASTMLLGNIYKKIHSLPISFWIILSLPLILYLIGKMPGFFYGESLAGVDEAYRFFFRIFFRAGTIAGNIVFGLAFILVAKRLKSSKLKDYLILAGIGDTIVGIALSTSAIEPTFGVAGHSLVLLSTFLFALGLQSSAISISQDLRLRKSIKDSAIEESKLLVSIGSGQLMKELENKVLLVVNNEREQMVRNTGIQPIFTDTDAKEYLKTVIKEIKVIRDFEDIVYRSKKILHESETVFVCSKPSGLRLAFNNYFDMYEKIMSKERHHNHQGVKIVTSLNDKNDIVLIKKFLEIGISIRHVKNIPPINFVVSDKEMIATIQKSESGQLIQNLLTTNEPAYIEHFVSIFENLWNEGVDINQKITDFEQGIDDQGIEIIHNPETIEKIIQDLLKSSKEEVVGIFATTMALQRQVYAGSFKLLKEQIKSKEIEVRFLVPYDDQIKDFIQKLEQDRLSKNIKIRIIEENMQTRFSLIVIDKSKSLTIEIKNDLSKTTREAVGLATFSNSKATVLSFYSIFESLWKQTELYEKLQIHEKMQKEFINIAAHELRTPIQPILGAAELLDKDAKEDKERKLIEMINRNARRLRKLSEDILDVTKIENYSTTIHKENFKLNEVIQENINNYRNNIQNNKVKFEYFNSNDVCVCADKNGISRVISNLIDNSIKFVSKEEGKISVTIEIRKAGKDDNKNTINGRQIAIVKIKDNGIGIDKEIYPKLFTKFATKSYQGIGLGLYISKSIVEAHGGKIWAENNKSESGATFSFSLIANNFQESI